MNEWDEMLMMIETGLLTVLLWGLCYGLNLVGRVWHTKQNVARRAVGERVSVVMKLPRSRWTVSRVVQMGFLTLMAVGIVRMYGDSEYSGIARQEFDRMLSSALGGLVLGGLVVGILWLFYRKSKAVNRLELHFDREGVTIFPARQRLAGQGAYETRVEWKDCTGYWVYRGYFVLAMRPIGQVEQFGGAEIARIEKILSRYGVRKLVSYDVVEVTAQAEQNLFDLQTHVLQMAEEVIAGYAAECMQLGVQVEAKIDLREDEDRYSVLVLQMRGEGTMLQEMEWLVWGADERTIERLGLTDDRLYEGLDERVHSLIESRQNEVGQEAAPAVYQ